MSVIVRLRRGEGWFWGGMKRAARAIPRERIEDYVAAATATGPLMPAAGRSPEIKR